MAGTYRETNCVIPKIVYLKGAGMSNTFVQSQAAYGSATNTVKMFIMSYSAMLSDMTLRYGYSTNNSGSAISITSQNAIFQRVNVISNLCSALNGYAGGALYRGRVISVGIVQHDSRAAVQCL